MDSSQASRIPRSLQAVFLASNRGRTIDQPPPDRSAFKVFVRRLFRKGSNLASKKEKTVAKKEVSATKVNGSISIKQTENLRNNEESVSTVINPQTYLNEILKNRGYSNKLYSALASAYHNKPTPLQLASYSVRMITVTRSKQHTPSELSNLLACGLSPNACNTYGESIIHYVCRRADVRKLQVLLEHGCSVQVCDDYGRTPMHDACWAPEPAFDVVQLLLLEDPRLFCITDARGLTPLSYVHKDHWPEWVAFLEKNKDHYWPQRDIATLGEENPPEMALLGPGTRPLKDPEHALTPDLAILVSSGRMTPAEAVLLKDDDDDSSTESSDFESSTWDDESDSEEEG